jgi:meiotic recombination protein SPO11
MSTYKYGSLAHLHDNARLSIPSLQWFGLKISEAIKSSVAADNGGLLALTVRDRKKAVTMLRNNPVLANDGPEGEWRVELQRMLMLNVKAEIESMYDRGGGLEMWIDRRMFRQE